MTDALPPHEPIARVANDYNPDGQSCRITEYLPAGMSLYARPSAMPALTDAMRAVLRNEGDVYQSEDELYAALCAAAESESVSTQHAASAGGQDALTRGARDVLAERQRQISVEGWTLSRDDGYRRGQMAVAAGCYALASGWPHNSTFGSGVTPPEWPWEGIWWKPTTPRRNLLKAGALILAEIERLDRAEGIEHE